MKPRPVLLIFLAALPAFLAVGALSALDWPLEKQVLTATFGENRTDHLHSGIDLGGGEEPVTPVAPGEVIFSYEENTDYSSLPIGLGTYIVLQHEGGVRSIYSHLKNGSLKRRDGMVETETLLGLVGDSGYSQGRHLHLSLIDTEMNTAINPLQVLPPLPDRLPPVIRRLLLVQAGERMELPRRATVQAGGAEVLVETFDPRPDVSFLWKLAPYRISLNVNGQETCHLVFDTIRAEQGVRLLSNRGLSFRQIYDSEWVFRLGTVDLRPGDTHLQVLVRDFAGNEVSRDALLHVQE